MAPFHRLIAAEDTVHLVHHGYLRGCGSDRFQPLHKSLVVCMGGGKEHDAPLILYHAPAEDYYRVPIAIISYEALLCVGLAETRAAELWAAWATRATKSADERRREVGLGLDDIRLKDLEVDEFAGFISTFLKDQADPTTPELGRCEACIAAQGMPMDPDHPRSPCLCQVDDFVVQCRLEVLRHIHIMSYDRAERLKLRRQKKA